jgi:serine/threonine protein kinase
VNERDLLCLVPSPEGPRLWCPRDALPTLPHLSARRPPIAAFVGPSGWQSPLLRARWCEPGRQVSAGRIREFDARVRLLACSFLRLSGTAWFPALPPFLTVYGGWPRQLGGALKSRHIGHYEIEELLGEGGIGQVYAARDTTLDRRVAVKMLRPELARNHEFVRRFHAEARSLGNLTHPNITTLYSLHTEGADAFMVMELVDGETLEAVLAREKRLGFRYAMAIFAQTIGGLGYAHRAGVVHRDIKPSNLMITRDGLVKIMDFGIAKIQGTHLTQTGVFQGTLVFASPEQIRGSSVDERSDQYSLAVVFYKMLTGEPLFASDSEYGLMTAHLETPPPPLPAQVPEEPRTAIMRALAKQPVDRFTSIEEFGRAAGVMSIRG